MVSFTLIDTDILIDVGRGNTDAIDCVQHIALKSALAISVVTQMELIVGCRNKIELGELNLLLQRFQFHGVTDGVSDKAVDYYSSIV